MPEFAQFRIKATSFWKRMEVKAGPGKGTVYAVLSGEKEAAHGLAPSLWIFDELGIAPDRQLLDALQTASRQARPVAWHRDIAPRLLMTGTPSAN